MRARARFRPTSRRTRATRSSGLLSPVPPSSLPAARCRSVCSTRSRRRQVRSISTICSRSRTTSLAAGRLTRCSACRVVRSTSRPTCACVRTSSPAASANMLGLHGGLQAHADRAFDHVVRPPPPRLADLAPPACCGVWSDPHRGRTQSRNRRGYAREDRSDDDRPRRVGPHRDPAARRAVGPPPGEPLLWITGFAISSEIFARRSSLVRRRFDCIRYDNRGSGRSPAPWRPTSIPELAGDAVRLLDALGVDSAHVYGLSMGGMIAQEMAIRFPDRVRALVLGGTTHGGPRSVPPIAERRDRARQPRRPGRAPRAGRRAGAVHRRLPQRDPALVRTYLSLMGRHRSSARGTLSHLTASTWHDTRAQAGEHQRRRRWCCTARRTASPRWPTRAARRRRPGRDAARGPGRRVTPTCWSSPQASHAAFVDVARPPAPRSPPVRRCRRARRGLAEPLTRRPRPAGRRPAHRRVLASLAAPARRTAPRTDARRQETVSGRRRGPPPADDAPGGARPTRRAGRTGSPTASTSTSPTAPTRGDAPGRARAADGGRPGGEASRSCGCPTSPGSGRSSSAGRCSRVEHEGEPADYLHAMYVDTLASIASGREISAFPKKFGDARAVRRRETPSSAPSTTAPAGRDRDHGLQARRSSTEQDARDEIGQPTYGLKLLPGYDRRPRICELVRSQITRMDDPGLVERAGSAAAVRARARAARRPARPRGDQGLPHPRAT